MPAHGLHLIGIKKALRIRGVRLILVGMGKEDDKWFERHISVFPWQPKIFIFSRQDGSYNCPYTN